MKNGTTLKLRYSVQISRFETVVKLFKKESIFKRTILGESINLTTTTER